MFFLFIFGFIANSHSIPLVALIQLNIICFLYTKTWTLFQLS